MRFLLLPYLLGIVGLVLLPAVAAFGLAFFQYDALSLPRWVGTLNFTLAYTDELFLLSVQNSLALILLPVPLRVAGAFLLARLLQRPGRGVAWVRTAVFVPNIIPTAAYALAWLWILNPLYGPLNILLRTLGLYAPAWLADPLWAKPGLVLMSLWLVGEGFLVCLAALQDIPTAVDDAATVDGVNSWTRFIYVTLPLMAPILLLLLFRDAILTFQNSFTAVMLMTQGDPYYATYTLPLFIYEQGFDLLSFGTASAALWIMYGLTGLIVIALYIIARQWDVGTTEDTFVL
ncbi:MAG: sugar ABC transporter permease [Anaerolineales bacterium]|nr:sugar ABC transporter permease [Anaerolineales bacterium]